MGCWASPDFAARDMNVMKGVGSSNRRAVRAIGSPFRCPGSDESSHRFGHIALFA